MASKLLSSRIALRYDTYANWIEKDPALLKGEAAICWVPADSSTGLNEPALLMKVGEDGVKTFSELPWISALSADTNIYARESAADFEAQIKEWAAQTAGVEYRLVANAGAGTYVYDLEERTSNGTAMGPWTVKSTLDLDAIDDRLDVIEGNAATAGSIANAIAVAEAYTDTEIAKLDAAITQNAGTDGLALSITEVDGKITAFSGSIAANTYDAYGDAADAEANAKAYADEILANAVDDLDSSVSADTANGKVLTGVTQANGLLTAVTEVALADVAYSGTAADVAIVDTAEKFTATNVEAALAELKGDVAQEASDRANAITQEVTDRNTAIATAIDGLDATITGMGAGKTIATLSEANGVIAATFEDIAIVSSQVTDAGTMITMNAATVGIGANGQVDAAYPNAGQVQTYVEQKIADLGTGLEYLGMATYRDPKHPTETIDECIARIIPAGHQLKAGDMVIVEGYNGGNSEFIYNGSEWEEFGNTGLYATKAELQAESEARANGDSATLQSAKDFANGAIAALDADLNVTGAHKVMTGITEVDGVITTIDEVELQNVAYSGNAADVAIADANGKITATTVEGALEEIVDSLGSAIDGLDGNAIATAADGNVYTVLTGVTEANGIISKQGEVTLAAVAKTGTAADVALVDANGKYTATNVEAALEEISVALDDAIDALDGNAIATAANGNKYSVLTGVTEANGVISKASEVELEAIAKTGNVNDLIQTAGDYLILDGGNASSFSA